MNAAFPPSNPRSNRRAWLPRFGTRTIFVLIGLAALAAWWARGEMLAEQRREELIAAYSESPNRLDLGPNNAPTWRQRIVALLRGKKVPPLVAAAFINQVGDPKQLVEFEKTFPVKYLWVQAAPAESTPEVLDAVAQCRSISHLNFTGAMDASDETLQRLARIRTQSGFSFWTARVDDEFLTRVADAGINCGRIGDSGAGGQGSWFHVTDDGLRSAAKLKNLTSLTANRSAGDEGLAAFRDHAILAEVELIGSSYTQASGDMLATLPSLRSLALIDTGWTDEAVAKSLSAGNIESLKLHNVEIGEKTAAAIANLKSLHTVDLKNVPLTPQLVAALAKHSVTWLTLEGDYDDQTIAGFSPLAPSLMWLSLATPSVTDAGVAWIGKAPMLMNLHLRDTSVTGATLRAPPARGTIMSLTLGGPNIKQMLADMRTMPGLVQILFYGENIDDEALAALPATVNALTLAGTKVTADGLKAFSSGKQQAFVSILYPEGGKPPLSEQEIEDIQAASQQQLKVTLSAIPANMYLESLPRSLQQRDATAADSASETP